MSTQSFISLAFHATCSTCARPNTRTTSPGWTDIDTECFFKCVNPDKCPAISPGAPGYPRCLFQGFHCFKLESPKILTLVVNACSIALLYSREGLVIGGCLFRLGPSQDNQNLSDSLGGLGLANLFMTLSAVSLCSVLSVSAVLVRLSAQQVNSLGQDRYLLAHNTVLLDIQSTELINFRCRVRRLVHVA